MTATIDDSFYLGPAKAGVILRTLSADGLRTTTCFELPDGSLFHARSEILFEGDFTEWTSYRYEDLGAGTDVQVTRADLTGVGRSPSWSQAASWR